MCSRWYRYQFNKFEKAWARVEILWLDFRKTPSNQNTKSSKVATFEICEIFCKYYFPYVWDYKATLTAGKYSTMKTPDYVIVVVLVSENISHIVFERVNTIKVFWINQPSIYLFKDQHWKYLNNLWNIFKVNKDIGATTLTSFCC